MPELGTFSFTSLGPKEVEFVAVASEEELPNGKRIFVTVDEYNIVVFNIAGQYFAIGDVCSLDEALPQPDTARRIKRWINALENAHLRDGWARNDLDL